MRRAILALFFLPLSLLAKEPRVKFVVQKKGARIPVLQILQDLNYQFRGKKVFIPHPTVLSVPPIVFHSTVELSYEELKTLLSVHGVELIEQKTKDGRILVVAYSKVSLATALRAMATPFFGPSEKLPEENVLVTQVFPVRYVDPNRVFALIRNMIFSNPARIGNAFFVPGAKVIILRDLKRNVEYYGKIIQALDTPPEEQVLKIVELENAKAEKAAQILTQLFQGKASPPSGASSQQTVRVLSDPRTNKVFIFAPKSKMEKILKILREIDEKMTEGEEARFYVLKLQNVKAEDLGPKINELLTGASSSVTGNEKQKNPAKVKPPTRIIPEPKSNSLLIQASREEFEKIKALVKQLDVAPPQVLIEAHIFEVEDSRTLNLGAELATIDNAAPGKLRGAGLTNFGLSQVIIDPNNPDRIRRIPSPLQGVVAGLHKGGLDRIPLLINLLGVDRMTNVLAQPFAVTNDNEEAIFKDETEIPTIQQNQTASDVTFITQQGSVTASTTLKITPHIGPDDSLRLDIDLQIEDFAAKPLIPNTTPPKTRRSYKGSVTVKNGQYLVIGGLTRKDYRETINKVPFLGDIPILGWFFSNRSKSERRFNIYIFIRAYVLPKGSKRNERITRYWLRQATQSSKHRPRENYGADMTPRQIKAKIRQILQGPEDLYLRQGRGR